MKTIKNLKKKIKNKKRAKWLRNYYKQLSKNPKKLKTLLVLVLLLAALYLYRGQFIVATVNNQPITRWELRKALEAQAGAQTLEGLVTESLISQEARNKGVQASAEEIEEEITKIRESLTAQGQDFDVLLQAQGVGLEEVKKQVGMQKTLEKLVDADVEVTQEEIDQYLEENKEFLPEDQEGLEEQVVETLRQNKLNQELQIIIANLQEKAKINYWL